MGITGKHLFRKSFDQIPQEVLLDILGKMIIEFSGMIKMEQLETPLQIHLTGKVHLKTLRSSRSSFSGPSPIKSVSIRSYVRNFLKICNKPNMIFLERKSTYMHQNRMIKSGLFALIPREFYPNRIADASPRARNLKILWKSIWICTYWPLLHRLDLTPWWTVLPSER